MSDLISRKALIERLRELGWLEPDENDTEIKLPGIINQMPDAYNVEKVVEQLKESDLLIDQEWCITVEDAVKIVKGGLEE